MVRVRYMVNDVEKAIAFYTGLLGFEVKMTNLSYFAMLTRDGVGLVLSPPFGPGANKGRQTLVCRCRSSTDKLKFVVLWTRLIKAS